MDVTRFAVVDATSAESIAEAVGRAEAAVLVALGGTWVDAMGTWVVVVWPKAIPKRRENKISGQIIVLLLMEASL